MRTVIALTISITISSCASLQATPDEYARCNLDKHEWNLLSRAPNNYSPFVDSGSANSIDEVEFLFLDRHKINLIQCRTPVKVDLNYIGCSSHSIAYAKTGHKWVVQDENSDGSVELVNVKVCNY